MAREVKFPPVTACPQPPACAPSQHTRAGLRGEELAVAREVKFQLGSTLSGLGTANLGALFDGYQVREGCPCEGLTWCMSRRKSRGAGLAVLRPGPGPHAGTLSQERRPPYRPCIPTPRRAR